MNAKITETENRPENTAAVATDFVTETKERLTTIEKNLTSHYKSDEEGFTSLGNEIDELDKHAIKGVNLNEIPEGAVLDAEPVANSTGLRAVVISDSMSIAEINDVMKRLSRHMEDLPASETSAAISMLSETAENIKALLDRLHLR